MSLQDLTPQLRTRLSRMERLVGLFVTAAALLLVFGLGYYIYELAKRKGWFLEKAYYSTGVMNAAGLSQGDRVKLMGFDVGTITAVVPNDPYDPYNVTIFFEIEENDYGYIWADSNVKVASADLLGKRNLEVMKGQAGLPTILVDEDNEIIGILDQKRLEKLRAELRSEISARFTDPDAEERKRIETEIREAVRQRYEADVQSFYVANVRSNAFWLTPLESPALADRLEKLVDQVESALPGVLDLTNQIASVLGSVNSAVSNLDAVAVGARPLVTNLTEISGNVRDPDGSLGEWIIPNDLQARLLETLGAANTFLTNSDSTLTEVATRLDQSLINLANITSNLNSQVQANSNILSEVSEAVVHSDELMQGLKRHWLLRSAFKDEDEDEEDSEDSTDTPRRGPIPTRGARIYR
jgi:ABC-type transporter Mla subunit MlaD